MTYNLSGAEDFVASKLGRNMVHILSTGLLLSRAKDENGQPRIDFAAETIALGIDTAYGVALTDPGEAEFHKLGQVFDIFLAVIEMVPPDDDAAIRTLVQALCKLRATSRPEMAKGMFEMERMWVDLPWFFDSVRDHFCSPRFASHSLLKQSSVFKFKAFTAFLARALATPDFRRSMEFFGLCQMRQTFEEALTSPKSEAMGNRDAEIECKLWTATEWVLHAAEAMYEYVCDENEDVDLARHPGALYMEAKAGRMGITRDRWFFWQRRLGELLAVEVVGDNEALKARMVESVRIMEEMGKRGMVKRAERKYARQEAIVRDEDNEGVSEEGTKEGVSEDSMQKEL